MSILQVIAHQFRTPLQTINNSLTVLSDEEELDGYVVKNLKLIEESSNQLSAVIDNIVKLSNTLPNLDNKNISDKEESNDNFTLDKLIKKCIFSNTLNTSKNSIILTNKTKNALELYGNEKLLRELINFSITNICSYTKNGLIEIVIKLVKKDNDFTTINFSFIDSKKVVNLEDKKNLFSSSLFHLNNENAYLNFNLRIIKNSINQFGGKLLTEIDKPFKTLSFDIPFKLVTKELIKTKRREKKIKLLIVEDCKVNQLLINNILYKEGYKCFTACNGLEAINFCKTKKVDLVLMDIMMPVVDGFHAAKID